MILKCVFCVVLSAIFATLAFADVSHTSDSLAQVKSSFEKKTALLVDVREQDEWNEGHVKGATLLPLSKLKSTPATTSLEIPQDKTLYVHCRSGKRSLVASELLLAKGYKDVRALEPGFSDLAKFGFPTEK